MNDVIALPMSRLLRALALLSLLFALALANAVSAQEPQPHATPQPLHAIVAQNQVALRAAPRDSAQRQAVLWQGDLLEIRGERQDYLQVYDHRRERGGYVRAGQVRRVSAEPETAGELLAVARFLRDAPGEESLGMAYVAAYLRAAPAANIDSEVFDLLGVMADRLARRASLPQSQADDSVIAAHLEVAAGLGVTMRSFESEGRMQICYEGDAFRRVLALPASDAQRARAALALTRPACVDPDLAPTPRYELDLWRRDVLALAPRESLPPHVRNRLRLRDAGVLASLAFQQARRGEAARETMTLALEALAGVDKLELSEIDIAAYDEAAVRVGASRWGVQAPPANDKLALSVSLAPGETGQTCVTLVERKRNVALAKRCTYAVVWPGSFTLNAPGTVATLAVQPLPGWRELWVFQKPAGAKASDDWRLDIVPPALGTPELGYVEFAGWVPGKAQLLAARETRLGEQFVRSFEVIDLATLAVQKRADQPGSLSVFYRSQDAAWKRQTVALR